MKLVLALVATAALVQSHPDFSGTWVEDESLRKTTFPVATGKARAATLPPADTVITQTASALSDEMTVMGHVIRFVYKLDGSESVNHNGANTMTTKSAWEGQTLVTQGTSFSVTSAGESNWIVKERRSLDKTGAMIVEMTYKDDSGKVDTTTRVFRRKK
jgi:hypothetical protein